MITRTEAQLMARNSAAAEDIERSIDEDIKAAAIYQAAIIEACTKAKVPDPRRVLTDADEFPRLLKISEVEYAIGWLNGCAETCGVHVCELWDRLKQRKARAA